MKYILHHMSDENYIQAIRAARICHKKVIEGSVQGEIKDFISFEDALSFDCTIRPNSISVWPQL